MYSEVYQGGSLKKEEEENNKLIHARKKTFVPSRLFYAAPARRLSRVPCGHFSSNFCAAQHLRAEAVKRGDSTVDAAGLKEAQPRALQRLMQPTALFRQRGSILVSSFVRKTYDKCNVMLGLKCRAGLEFGRFCV